MEVFWKWFGESWIGLLAGGRRSAVGDVKGRSIGRCCYCCFIAPAGSSSLVVPGWGSDGYSHARVGAPGGDGGAAMGGWRNPRAERRWDVQLHDNGG